MTLPGEVIAGRYVLCDPIGTGGSGTVWRAFDRKRQSFCAAKLLRQRDAGGLLRFVREQAVRLHDPHISSPYAWAADEGMVLIASELLDGGSLQTLLGDWGPLADTTIVEVLDQVLRALHTVHAAQLIHRDVKPGNLLLRATGRGPLQLLLTDFGLTISRQDARITVVGTVVGTPGYLPPEVLAGHVPPDPRHDLYAVGQLALTMLTGYDVSDAGQFVAGRSELEETSPEAGAASPDDRDASARISDPALRNAIRAMIRRNPQQRPADAAAALELLRECRRDPVPRSRDGEIIDVIGQLPALPPEWLPEQPANSGVGRHTLVDVEISELPARVPSVPTAPPPVSVRPTRAEPSRVGRAAVGALAGLAVAAVVMTGIVLLRRDGKGDPSTVPVLPSGGSTVSGQVSPVSEPTAASPAVTSNVTAGDPCGWQQGGDRVSGTPGTLICTLRSGEYRWIPPGA